LYDVDGREYLDLVSAWRDIARHAHPDSRLAISEQASTLLHTPIFTTTRPGQVAPLTKMVGHGAGVLRNSGAEAVEGCLKFARRYWYTQGVTTARIFAIQMHSPGRTMGALSVTWDEHYGRHSSRCRALSHSSPRAIVAALQAAVTERSAAIIAEPIQGEGGIGRYRPNSLQAITNDARHRTLFIAEKCNGLGAPATRSTSRSSASSLISSASGRRSQRVPSVRC